jgi:hypothetical protein
MQLAQLADRPRDVRRRTRAPVHPAGDAFQAMPARTPSSRGRGLRWRAAITSRRPADPLGRRLVEHEDQGPAASDAAIASCCSPPEAFDGYDPTELCQIGGRASLDTPPHMCGRRRRVLHPVGKFVLDAMHRTTRRDRGTTRRHRPGSVVRVGRIATAGSDATERAAGEVRDEPAAARRNVDFRARRAGRRGETPPGTATSTSTSAGRSPSVKVTSRR